jgi:hypothetical protein
LGLLSREVAFCHLNFFHFSSGINDFDFMVVENVLSKESGLIALSTGASFLTHGSFLHWIFFLERFLLSGHAIIAGGH